MKFLIHWNLVIIKILKDSNGIHNILFIPENHLIEPINSYKSQFYTKLIKSVTYIKNTLTVV